MRQILGWANSKLWIWPWVVAELVSLIALQYPHYQGELSSIAMVSLPNAAANSGQGQHSYSHTLGTSLPAHTPPEPTAQSRCGLHSSSAAAGKGPALLYCVA